MDLKQKIDLSSHHAIAGMDIPWMLEKWATKTPDKTAMVWCPFDGETQRYSYDLLFDRARKLAAGLGMKGVQTGDFVILHMDNAPEFVEAWYACAILGAVAVSTNTRSVARDLTYFADVTNAVCALTQPKYAQLISQACPDLSFIAITDTNAGAPIENPGAMITDIGAVEFNALYAEKPLAISEPDPNRNLGVQFTSGTTSRPKAVLWTHANGIWAAKTNASHFRLGNDDIGIVFLPLFHTNAQAYSMLATHWSGGTIVLQPKFSASRFWQVCLENRVTWASMIPFTIKALMDQPVPEHQMRFWSFAAHLPEIEDHFGVDVFGLWGMTETLSHGIVVDPQHRGPRMTLGRPAPEYDIQLRRDDGGVCSLGETGKLFIRGVRGVSLFKEYYRDQDANRRSFDEDGWFDTGDIVRTDQDGWMYFCDRDKDMLKVGAENVAASEVEHVIMQTGLAQECAVVAQRHYMLDEVPVAFVIPTTETSTVSHAQIEAKIIKHCKANLPDFKVVRSVHVVQELPRSTLEKVAKNELRDRLPEILKE